VNRKIDYNTNLVSTLPISSDILPFFIKSNEEGKNSKKARKRSRRMCESSPPSDLLMSWSKPQTRKPRDDTIQCVMIVSKLCGEYLSPADTKSLGDAEGLFFFPSLPTVEQGSTHVQEFYGRPPCHYSTVMESINGISPSDANKVLMKRSKSGSYRVLCV
jgi:hypothetical protein